MGGFTDFIEFSQKNKPQGNAVSGGIFVLLVSGMQMGWIFDSGIDKLNWAEGRTKLVISIAYMSFYIAAVLGLYAASATINRLTKQNIYVSHVTIMNRGGSR
jgi:hypothetical protein